MVEEVQCLLVPYLSIVTMEKDSPPKNFESQQSGHHDESVRSTNMENAGDAPGRPVVKPVRNFFLLVLAG